MIGLKVQNLWLLKILLFRAVSSYLKISGHFLIILRLPFGITRNFFSPFNRFSEEEDYTSVSHLEEYHKTMVVVLLFPVPIIRRLISHFLSYIESFIQKRLSSLKLFRLRRVF